MLSDIVKKDTEVEVKINWIEKYDYDLFQYVKNIFNNRHFSRVILSIKPSNNILSVHFVNLAHDRSMLLESKPLNHISWNLEQGIIKELNKKQLVVVS